MSYFETLSDKDIKIIFSFLDTVIKGNMPD
jgi:hypothetical protein